MECEGPLRSWWEWFREWRAGDEWFPPTDGACVLERLPTSWSPRWWETYDGPLAVGTYFSELFLFQVTRTTPHAARLLAPTDTSRDAT